MTSEGADKIIAKVEGLVSEAVSKLEFKSGDRQTTQVLPGFPFSLIKEIPQETGSYEREEVAPWFPDGFGYYSVGTPTGSRVFFLPFDPTTKLNGVSCYATPRPSIFIPGGVSRYIYLEQTFDVSAWEVPNDEDEEEENEEPPFYVLESVTAGPARIFAATQSNIPSSSYPQTEGLYRYDLYYPGTYTYYFLLAKLTGVAEGKVRRDSIPPDVWQEYEEENRGAVKMYINSPTSYYFPFIAPYPVWVFYSALTGGTLGNTSGDVAAEGGWQAPIQPTP